MPVEISESVEWLEPDGLGGFASGTTAAIRTRRYHALLLSAATPPTGRMVLVSGVEVWVRLAGVRVALTTERYDPGVEYPDGSSRLASFEADPWPAWTWRLPDGSRIRHELTVPRGRAAVLLTWHREGGAGPATLEVRPFLAGRDAHALHHENPAFDFAPAAAGDCLVWHPYDGVPAIHCRASGPYRHRPDWYRRFFYTAEAGRGLDAVEDLASPGVFELDAGGPGAALVFTADADVAREPRPIADAIVALRDAERTRRAGLGSRLARAADAYVVRRGEGHTIVAGYPWFTDWGRDTFVAMRGLVLATRRFDVARSILVEWAGLVRDGLLPNRFPDAGATPEYNSVDAALWFVVAAGEFLEACKAGHPVTDADRAAIERAVAAVVEGYVRGTAYGIRMDGDGLLACGEPGTQVTWMDARVAGRPVTPRVGKPIEVQALWVNALDVAARREPRWRAEQARARAAFDARAWNADCGCLYDVIDADHVPGRMDPAVRPNQILALGGLPLALVEGDRARAALAVVRRQLDTPLGLRSLSPGEPAYRGRYEGGVESRDGAYHQGTAWPWLAGALVDAVLRWSPPAEGPALARAIVAPLVAHLDAAGYGHVSEVADGDAPFTPRGCPFQAWSVGELIRALDRIEAVRSGPHAATRREDRATEDAGTRDPRL